MTSKEEEFNLVLDKIVEALITTIDNNPYFKTLDVREHENDKFISLMVLVQYTEFKPGILKDFFSLLGGNTPNPKMPLKTTFLGYHLPREILDEIIEKSETFRFLKLKGFKVNSLRIFKKNFQVVGYTVTL